MFTLSMIPVVNPHFVFEAGISFLHCLWWTRVWIPGRGTACWACECEGDVEDGFVVNHVTVYLLAT